MSPCCDLDLEDSKQFSFCMTLWLTMLHHHTKFDNKMFCSSEDIIQTFTNTLNLAVTLTLNAIIQFFHRTLQLMTLYYQTKFDCKHTSSLEDIVEIVIHWLYKPMLWPWHWRQWTNFSAWNSISWCSISKPSLVTKCSVVQKNSSGQTFTNILNLHCDIDLERSNPIFPQDILASDGVMLYYQTKFGCKRTSCLKDGVEIVIFWLY